MIIRITDIPLSGRDLQFVLDKEPLNTRVNSVRDRYEQGAVKPPEYLFLNSPEANLHLEIQGLTVVATGSVVASFNSPCSRCGEQVEVSTTHKIRIVLKPRPEDGGELEDEDVDFGYYDGKEINCGSIVEEAIVLNLPYAVYCSDNGQECEVPEIKNPEPEPFVDERFAVLKNIKLN